MNQINPRKKVKHPWCYTFSSEAQPKFLEKRIHITIRLYFIICGIQLPPSTWDVYILYCWV